MMNEQLGPVRKKSDVPQMGGVATITWLHFVCLAKMSCRRLKRAGEWVVLPLSRFECALDFREVFVDQVCR